MWIKEEALEILSLSARKVAVLCGYLPLALSVVGSSVIESHHVRNIEDVLKSGV